MDKIQKIQKFFCTDKWWGKVLFIIVSYLLFWFMSYGIWMFNIIPDTLNLLSSDLISFIYFFILIPAISFYFAFLCKKVVNTIYLYIFNIIYILISLLLFLFFIFSSFSFSF